MAGFADINHWQLTGRMARDAEVQESKGRKRLRLRVAVHESGAPDPLNMAKKISACRTTGWSLSATWANERW